MRVKELSLGVSIYPDVWVEAYDLSAPICTTPLLSQGLYFFFMCAKTCCEREEKRKDQPQMRKGVVQNSILEPGFCPNTMGELGVMDLKAVVDPDGHTSLRLARGRNEREVLQEGDIIATQGAREEGPQDDDLVGHKTLDGEVSDGEGWLERRPGW